MNKLKKKTKIIITIIIILCIIIGGAFVFLTSQTENKIITLSQTQINIDNNILNKFIYSIINNDKISYESLTTNDMNENNVFDTLVSNFNSLGQLKSFTYKETIKSGEYYDVIFNASFTKKDNITLILTLNNDNKIAGIHT